jgi:hypothetical protein
MGAVHLVEAARPFWRRRRRPTAPR